MTHDNARHVRRLLGGMVASANRSLGLRYLRDAVEALDREHLAHAYSMFSKVQFHLDRAREIDQRARARAEH